MNMGQDFDKGDLANETRDLDDSNNLLVPFQIDEQTLMNKSDEKPNLKYN